MKEAEKKQVDENISQHNASWTFDNISDSFDEHIRKSIPLYREGHQLIAYYSDFFLKADSLVYDIGCSTGSMLARLAERHPLKHQLQFIGIDSVPDMVVRARQLSARDPRLSFVDGDALDFDFKPCDMIIANYTVQFLPPRVRQVLIDQIYQALNWGGGIFYVRKSPCAGRPFSRLRQPSVCRLQAGPRI